MKLIYRGKFKKDKLPIADLPEGAVKFREPNNELTLNLVAILFSIPILFIIVGCVFLKGALWQDYNNEIVINFIGIALLLISMVPHELIHAICFPREAEVHMFIAGFGMCVGSTHPISKTRLILMSLAPNIIFGVIPMIVWILMPSNSDILFTFAALSLLSGAGDLMNIFNAVTQMPKGAMQQLSGFNSYWYMP